MNERDAASPLDPATRRRLQAVIADPATPGYATIRAVAALGDDDVRRAARQTAMGREFVLDARRTARERGAETLLDAPPMPLERLLDAGTARVRGGETSWTMKHVEADAQIPHRTLYNAFRKPALIEACSRRAQLMWRARFAQRVRDEQPDPMRRPITLIDLLFAWVGSAAFAGDQRLRIRASSFVRERRDDDLREHLDAIVRFATEIADEAEMLLPEQYGVFVAATVEGAAAWFDRRSAGYAGAIAFVETLLARSRSV